MTEHDAPCHCCTNQVLPRAADPATDAIPVIASRLKQADYHVPRNCIGRNHPAAGRRAKRWLPLQRLPPDSRPSQDALIKLPSAYSYARISSVNPHVLTHVPEKLGIPKGAHRENRFPMHLWAPGVLDTKFKSNHQTAEDWKLT